jgi:cytochrome c oxidase cbb3-type subunit III
VAPGYNRGVMRPDSTTGFTAAATAAAVLALAGVIAAQTGPAGPQQRPGQPRPAPARPAASAAAGEAVTRKVCGTACHSFEHVISVRRTRAQWDATIENMIGRGAKATGAEVSTILDFLSSAHTLSPTTIRGGSGPLDKPMVDPKAVQLATPLYTSDCQPCHGADARGTSDGANLVRSEVVLHDRYGSTLGPYLAASHPPVPAAGKAGAGATRPLTPLTSMQVLLLSHFLRERVHDTLRGSPLFKPGNVLTGNASAGEEYFNGEGGCAKCHTPGGDLAAIGRRMDPITIQQRFLFPNNVGSRRRATPAPVTRVTVTTASGETLSGALVYMDDFNVSLRDESGSHRTVRRAPDVRVVKDDPYAAHIELLSRISDKAIHDVVAYLAGLK